MLNKKPTIPLPRDVKALRITREGRWFILLLLGVGIAAINTGNNLLYLIFSLKTCLFVSQILLGELNLKNLTLSRTAPARAVCGEQFSVTLHITNNNKYLPIFNIQLRDIIDGRRFKRSGHFLKASARETRHIEYRCEMHRRGISHFNGILISTAFPFGLTERSKAVSLTHDIIIWPAKIPVYLPRNYSSMWDGHVPIALKGSGDEYWQLRSFEYGDDARRVSWKASARQNRLMLMDTQARSNRKASIVLVLDRSVPDDTNETLIRVAASLIDLLHRQKIAAGLTTGQTRTLQSLSGSGPLLDHLALLDVAIAVDNPPARVPSNALVISPASAPMFMAHPFMLTPESRPSRPSEEADDTLTGKKAAP